VIGLLVLIVLGIVGAEIQGLPYLWRTFAPHLLER
jgi:hypothetical protein